MKNVYIYQRVLPHYRVPFFRLLATELKKSGIELIVIYGQESEGSVPKTTFVDEPWALYKPNYYLKIKEVEITLQSIDFKRLYSTDLIILEQSNRLLINYLFLLIKLITGKKIAFWGHGANFQSHSSTGVRERFKRWYSTFADWWFCYTPKGKEIVESLGYDASSITIVNNSVDVRSLIEEKTRLRDEDVRKLKDELNLSGSNIAVYCGGMYKEKRIQFLLDSCIEIRKKVDDFQMLFIGGGPDDYLVKEFCSHHYWAKQFGPISGVERVKYFKLSKLQLMPGLVGLGILDSFALGVPLFTTNIDYHSPEIEYLDSGYNGMIVDDTHYSDTVIKALTDDDTLSTLGEGCAESVQKYSLDQMVSNYAKGIVNCLGVSV